MDIGEWMYTSTGVKDIEDVRPIDQRPVRWFIDQYVQVDDYPPFRERIASFSYLMDALDCAEALSKKLKRDMYIIRFDPLFDHEERPSYKVEYYEDPS